MFLCFMSYRKNQEKIKFVIPYKVWIFLLLLLLSIMDKNTQKTTPQTEVSSKTLSKPRIFFGLLFCFISIVMFLSFISYLLHWKADQSQAGTMLDKTVKSTNIFGKIGDWLGNIFVFESIGIAAFIVAFLLFMMGTLILKKHWFKPWKTLGHSLFFICWLPIFTGAITQGKGVLSGVYGFQIMDFLSSVMGTAGLWLTVLASIAVYFILEFNLRPSAIKNKLQEINDQTVGRMKSILPHSDEEFETDTTNLPEEENLEIPEYTESHSAKETTHPYEKEPVKSAEEPFFSGSKIISSTPEVIKPGESISLSAQTETLTIPKVDGAEGFDFKVEVAEEKDDIDEIQQKSQDLIAKQGYYDPTLDLPHFKMPTVDLLKDYGNEGISINKDELEENKNKIVGLLKNFNVGISEIKATIGPTVTLYEIVPEAGIRVSAIKKLQDDIALNLSALGIRIIAPMPGKGTIGIEVPRKNPSMVSMRSVIASHKFQNSDMDLPVVFGKTISNEIFMADLTKMPHLLMAGATGQGKSVGINAILTSLLYKKHPSELKFVLVDPKKVELTLYSKIERHYLAKLPDAEDAIITDTTKVINTLNSLCIEMDTRYELLKSAFCRTIKEYNKKFQERKLNPENGHRYLPYIVLVVDEFADLIMTAGKEVEHPIARLAQLARAVGIHLIVATQRPSVNVITGMIKANFPARVAFRVISSVDSRTILDSPGADQLIGKGDMLYFNGNEILRLQCAFVDTPEVERLADYIGEQRGYTSALLLPEYSSDESSASTSAFDPNERDALFDDAARIVVGTQQGSTSMLQRQLKLGYNRAGRIMDQLEGAGIVGSFNGAKAREVQISDLHSLEQFLEDLKKK